MSFDEKYEIIKNNDDSYDLVFYYAVKSTGIFCKPSCKSKLPKKENVDFYSSAEDAIRGGYRPCKRCRSDLYIYNPMEEVACNIKNKIDNLFVEYELMNKEISGLGLSKKRMVEIFKEEYGMTPGQYVNFLRIDLAKKLLLKSDDKIVDVAYAAGFNSLSAFYRFFKEKENVSPARYRKENS